MQKGIMCNKTACTSNLPFISFPFEVLHHWHHWVKMFCSNVVRTQPTWRLSFSVMLPCLGIHHWQTGYYLESSVSSGTWLQDRWSRYNSKHYNATLSHCIHTISEVWSYLPPPATSPFPHTSWWFLNKQREQLHCPCTKIQAQWQV